MKNILVVEDDRSLNFAIRKKLTLEGFQIFSADNVKSAIDILREKQIDAVWLDHYLIGKESGLDLVYEMKKPESDWKKIPIMIVSNTAGPDKVQSYIKLGVDKYYTKATTDLSQIVEDLMVILAK